MEMDTSNLINLESPDMSQSKWEWALNGNPAQWLLDKSLVSVDLSVTVYEYADHHVLLTVYYSYKKK